MNVFSNAMQIGAAMRISSSLSNAVGWELGAHVGYLGNLVGRIGAIVFPIFLFCEGFIFSEPMHRSSFIPAVGGLIAGVIIGQIFDFCLSYLRLQLNTPGFYYEYTANVLNAMSNARFNN